VFVERLQKRLHKDRAVRVFANVIESATDLQLTLKSLGFVATKVKKNFYPQRTDAYLMLYRMPVPGRDDAPAEAEERFL
jgi:ribosomal protein S18 acetylase RimI-like enzyme